MITARQAQVLTALKDHAAGLKSKEIIKVLDDDRSSLIAEEKELSTVIYSLRNSVSISASLAKCVNKYFITPRGKKDLVLERF